MKNITQSNCRKLNPWISYYTFRRSPTIWLFLLLLRAKWISCYYVNNCLRWSSGGNVKSCRKLMLLFAVLLMMTAFGKSEGRIVQRHSVAISYTPRALNKLDCLTCLKVFKFLVFQVFRFLEIRFWGFYVVFVFVSLLLLLPCFGE